MGEIRPELALPAPPAPRGRRARAPRSPRAARPSSSDLGTPAGAVPERASETPATALAANVDPELLARLKGWRTDEARRKGMPPYVVFHDSTLEALAAARPRDLEALRQVRGVGPAKLEAYGDTLLSLLSD
jgi:ATP-dependent DNA helicase RecQ